MTKRQPLTFLAALLFLATAPAQDWPSWRGPNLDSTQPSSGALPTRWSPTENIAWRTELPSWSASSPVVSDDTVFVTSAQEGFSSTGEAGMLRHAIRGVLSKLNSAGEILLLALDSRDGSIRWRQTIGDGNRIWLKQNEASPSPVTDGAHVWTATGGGAVSCLSLDGKLQWRRNLQDDYGDFGLNWGYASSPLLHRGRLYIEVLHGYSTDDPSYVLALNPADGKTLWRVERPTDAVTESPDAYTTPTVATIDEREYLVVSGAGYVTLHDLESGSEAARAGGQIPNQESNYRVVGSPTVVGDLLLAPSRRNPLLAFTLQPGPALERRWSFDRGPDVPTPAVHDGRVYTLTDRGVLTILNLADGSPAGSPLRLEPGTYSASPVIADAKLYAVSEEGSTSVLDLANPTKVAAVNRLDEYTLSTPAIANNRIYIRTAQALYAITSR